MRNRKPLKLQTTAFYLLLLVCWSSLSKGQAIGQWERKVVYQLLTDRFARTTGDTGWCRDLHSYCSGSFRGVVHLVSYLKDLGVDAVWISPYVSQTAGVVHSYPDGYHGLWPKNLYESNQHFGTHSDLQQLVSKLHEAGISVMAGITPNNMGYGSISSFNPFNKSEHFHNCDGCTSGCGFQESNPTQIEVCRVNNLPDLDTQNRFVRDEYVRWLNWTTSEFKFNAYYVYDALHLDGGFRGLLSSSTGVPLFGEYSSTDSWEEQTRSLPRLVSAESGLTTALSYPLAHVMNEVFVTRSQDMTRLSLQRRMQSRLLGNRSRTMAVFSDSHDRPRSLCTNGDIILRKNALAFQLFTEGIPVLYYGDEQGMRGQHDPLWHSGYYRNHELFNFLKSLIWYRKELRLWEDPVVDIQTADAAYYVFARGDAIIAINNCGKDRKAAAEVALDAQLVPEHLRGLLLYSINNRSVILNLTAPNADGAYTLHPSSMKEPQVFVTEFRLPPVGWHIPISGRRGAQGPRDPASVNLALYMWPWPAALLLFAFLLVFSGSQKKPRTNARADLVLWHGSQPHAHDSDTQLEQGRGIVLNEQRKALSIQSKAPPQQSTFATQGFSIDGLRPDDHTAHLPAMEASSFASVQTSSDGQSTVQQIWMDSLQPSTPPNGNELEPDDDPDDDPDNDLPYMLPVSLGQQPSTLPPASSPKGGRLAVPSRAEMFGKQPAPAAPLYEQTRAISALPALGPLNDAPPMLEPSKSRSPRAPQQPGMLTRMISSARRTFVSRWDSIALHSEQSLTSGGGRGWLTPSTSRDLESASSVTRAMLMAAGRMGGRPDAALAPASGGLASAPAARQPVLTAVRERIEVAAVPKAKAAKPPPKPPKQEPKVVAAVTDLVLHVTPEYSIPQHFADNFTYGGVGRVVDVFIRYWPGRMAICAPLYADAFDGPHATTPRFATNSQPAFSFNATVGDGYQRVDVYVLADNQRVSYYLISADIFRHRRQADLCSFADETQLLTWLSVFNQATAVITIKIKPRKVHFHDYHGALSLLYLPEDKLPQVTYLAHNAHLNGAFSIDNHQRRKYLYAMLDLEEKRASKFCEHRGSLDLLHAAVMYVRTYQAGVGIVTVSDRYAEQAEQRLSVFWKLGKGKLMGITNGIEPQNTLANFSRTADEIAEPKRKAKVAVQQMYQLEQGKQYTLMVYLAQLSHLKGVDVLAAAAPQFLRKHKHLQLVVMGAVSDMTGTKVLPAFKKLAAEFPGRVYCGAAAPGVREEPGAGYVGGDWRTVLLRAADWCLCPSRVEPFGLVDVEFGWSGALCIGHDTGGLGKMPGAYYRTNGATASHHAAKLNRAIDKALGIKPEERQLMVEDALAARFPVEPMMRCYMALWHDVEEAFEQEELARRLPDTASTLFNVTSGMRRGGGSAKHLAELKREASTGSDLSSSSRYSVFDCGPMGQCKLQEWMLSVLQPLTLLPAVLVLSYMTFTVLYERHVEGCPSTWDSSATTWIPLASRWQNLGFRVGVFLAVSTAVAPIWTLLLFAVRPSWYAAAVAGLLLKTAAVVHIAFYHTELLNYALLAASVLAGAGPPLTTLGVGTGGTAVADTPFGFHAEGEILRGLMLTIGALLASFSRNNDPYLIVSGICLVVSAGCAAWYALPGALPHGQPVLSLEGTRLGVGRLCFWMGLLVAGIDTMCATLVVLAVLRYNTLRLLLLLWLVSWGSMTLALYGWSALLFQSWAQLNSRRWMLLLAGLPFLALSQVLAVQLSGADVLITLLVAGLAAEMLAAPRGPLIAALTFRTLPSREGVALWQMLLSLTIGFAAFVLVAVTDGEALSVSANDVFVAVGALEAVRALAVAVMAAMHKREDLTEG